jgi:cytochrome c peroxidase
MKNQPTRNETQQAFLLEAQSLPNKVADSSIAIKWRRGQAWLPALVAIAIGLALAYFGRSLLPDTQPTPRHNEQPSPGSAPQPHGRLNEPLQPLPPVAELNPNQVRLGEKLFHDPHLSANGTVACATCHDIAHGGGDGRKHSIGINAREGDVNAPTVLNSGLNFRQFWNGRAKTLEEQVDGPVTNPSEMGSNWTDIVQYLQNDGKYRELFTEAFGKAPSAELAKTAIANFERSLLTPSRFDRWLRGDDSALSNNERKGYELFKGYRCNSCHSGDNVGGNMFQQLGAMTQYFSEGRKLKEIDYGRFAITGKDYDRFVFRVPPLRNVGETAPYFHDGSVATLPEAVRIMIKYQLGREIVPADVDLITSFLHCLSGEDVKTYKPAASN